MAENPLPPSKDENASQPPATTPPPPKKRRWLRRLLWTGAGLLILLIAFIFSIPWIAAPIIRAKLQDMVSQTMNAELHMGRISYVFPYGVELRDTSLVAKDPKGGNVDLLSLPRLHLSLAKLPFGKGPLVINRFELTEPAVHVIKTADGYVGFRELVKSESKTKLSEMLELRLFKIDSGQVVYEDRTLPNAVPTAWRNIDVTLNTNPRTNPIYGFDFTAASGPMTSLKADGKINIDSFDTDLEKFLLALKIEPGQKESAAPPSIQEAIASYQLRGKLEISGKAHVSMSDPNATTYDVALDLTNGHARPEGWQSDLDGVTVKVRASSAPMDPAQVQLASALGIAPSASKPPLAYAMIDQISARSGANGLAVQGIGNQKDKPVAAIAVFDSSSKRWGLDRMNAHLNLKADRSELPEAMRQAAEQAGIVGIVDVAIRGQGTLPATPQQQNVYDIRARATSNKLLLTDRGLPLTKLVCDVHLTPQAVEVLNEKREPGFNAEAFKGSLRAGGQLTLPSPGAKAAETTYMLSVAVKDVDTAQFAKAWNSKGGQPLKLTGIATGVVNVNGSLPATTAATPAPAPATTAPSAIPAIVEKLTGNGQIEINNGNFYELPVLAQIFDLVAPKSKAARIGHAAATFTIARSTLHLSNAAVSAPLLGVTGSGDIGLIDQKLNMVVQAAPLNDWQEQLKKGGGIPVVGEIAGQYVGQAQKFLDTTTKNYVKGFKVTGTIQKPSIVPQVDIGGAGSKVLQEMMKNPGKLPDLRSLAK